MLVARYDETNEAVDQFFERLVASQPYQADTTGIGSNNTRVDAQTSAGDGLVLPLERVFEGINFPIDNLELRKSFAEVVTASRFADDLDKLNKRYRNSSSWINPKTVARAAEIFESTPLALDSIQFAAVQVPAKEIIVNQHEQYNFVLAFFVGIIG